MSPTFERRARVGAHAQDDVETLLTNASAAGMDGSDIERWRHALSPSALDLCGCMASVLATAAALAVSLCTVFNLVPERRLAASCGLFAATLLVAVAAKLVGQGLALRRRQLRMRSLWAAVRACRGADARPA